MNLVVLHQLMFYVSDEGRFLGLALRVGGQVQIRVANREAPVKQNMARSQPKCGEMGMYKRGCRCEPCRAAKRATRKAAA